MSWFALTLTPAAIPLQLHAMLWWQAGLLFMALAAPVVLLGLWSLAGLGPVRKWVAIGVRLAVIAVLVLLLGDVRWQRTHRDLEVIVLRDVSDSTQLVNQFPADARSVQDALTRWLTTVAEHQQKPQADRIGIISFNRRAVIDALPFHKLLLDARAIGDDSAREGTNPAAAIQLALATFSDSAMRRLLLVWDGNATEGDLEAAILAARAGGVPIDVMPLSYDVRNEVMLDRIIAPTWQRENEPFTIEVLLRSTNPVEVTGNLSVRHQDQLMDLDEQQSGIQPTRRVTLKPGLNVHRIRVPALREAGVHTFRAGFDVDGVDADIATPGMARQGAGDTLLHNNSGEAFTFVRGKGQVLYVDNVPGDAGRVLERALTEEGINVRRIVPAAFPVDAVRLQNYDAVVLANVPFGRAGLTDAQQQMLANYVHDLGGGLVMIGGEDAFGAGGWQGTRLEAVLPVNMDVPAQRQIPKGALVLVIHSCEMPDGNFWGLQCALQAIDTLGAQDEVGIITYDWGVGQGQWDFPLQEKGDGSKAKAAAKNLKQGDMPSFQDTFDLALDGRGQGGGLTQSNARQKHVIVISDGDPAPPRPETLQAFRNAKITASTITVFPHGGAPDTMSQIAQALGGRSYGPITANFNQLPQIFTKEATVVRRSLIFEDAKGIPVQTPAGGDLIRGLADFPTIFGMVLTTRKDSPQVDMPLIAGKAGDPLLAHWQTGLGKSAAFTSDAHARWLVNWLAGGGYGKFWAQVVRGVARPTVSGDFDTTTTIVGDRGRIVVEALGRDSARLNFLNIVAHVQSPDGQIQRVRLTQTGPGAYQGEFPAGPRGSYVVVMNYSGSEGQEGLILAGAAKSSSPEQRALRSDMSILKEIADRTGGRVLSPFDANAFLFAREQVRQSASAMPAWDVLLVILLFLFLLDVAVRRIAWDYAMFRRGAQTVGAWTSGLFTTRRIETRDSLDALRRVRQGAEHQRQGDTTAATAATSPTRPSAAAPAPDPSRKFEAEGVEGDITDLVGGAKDKPLPSAPRDPQPRGAHDDSPMGGLLAAKKRAQEQMRKKQSGEEK